MLKKWTLKKGVLGLALLGMLAMTACGGGSNATSSGANPATGKTASIKVSATLFHSEEDAFASLFKKWKEEVETQSEGRIEIQPSYSGSLVTLHETFDAVKNGTVDMGLVAATSVSGVIPEMGLMELHAGYTPNIFNDYQNFYKNVNPLMKEIYSDAGVELLFWGPSSKHFAFLHPSKTLISLEDFNGQRMRSDGRWQPQQLKALGINTVNMDPSELYLALQNGTLDATGQILTLAYSQRLFEVGPKISLVSSGTNSLFYIANENFVKKMPEDLRAIMESASEKVALENWNSILDENEANAIEGLKAVGGDVEVYEMTEEESKAIRDKYLTVSVNAASEIGGKAGELNDLIDPFR